MEGLLKLLPPFAPDYSGVCSVLFSLEGLVVIQDAAGCTGNFTCYDEPRWYGCSSAIFSSELREIDAVLGDDEKLINRIQEAASRLNKNFVAIIGSPAPMVIGTDYNAVARIISKRTGLTTLYFDTSGINTYEKGASAAQLEIAKYLVEAKKETISKGVNILGATPLDFGSGKQIESLHTLLKDTGFHVISTWGMISDFEEIKKAADASLNVVVSWSGLATARYMKSIYNIPYVIGFSTGRVQQRQFLEKLFQSGNNALPNPFEFGDEILVIGEQIAANAIREALLYEHACSKIVVASFFEMDEALKVKGDIRLNSENELKQLIDYCRFDVVIGDPLYKGFFNPQEPIVYLSVPHIAVSSRLFWDKDYTLSDGNWLNTLASKASKQQDGWTELTVY